MKTQINRILLGLAACLGACATALAADGSFYKYYSSGSSGVDGAFNPVVSPNGTSWTVTGATPGSRGLQSGGVNYVDVPLPTNGVFNFTTVTIPKNTRVRFLITSNMIAHPPPVFIYASGDIRIAGEISVTSKDTAAALAGVVSGNNFDDNSSYNGADAWVPGPGAYRGAMYNGEPGTGPSFMFHYYNNSIPGYNQVNSANTEPFSLPLRGGSGGGYNVDRNASGCGGGGVLYLASSGKIIFDTDSGSTGAGIIFKYSSYYNWDWAHYPQLGGWGMAAIFANEIVGWPRQNNNHANGYPRMLVSACFHNYDRTAYNSQGGFTTTPYWPVGVLNTNMMRFLDPIVRITQFHTNQIPTGDRNQMDLYHVPTPGNYALTLETINLPPGLIFNVTVRGMDQYGRGNGGSTVAVFPATTPAGGGVCRTTSNVPIGSGYQYIFAKASAVIPTTAMAPSFQGSPLEQWRYELNPDGKSRVMFATAKGAVLSQEAAIRLALEQGRWQFIQAFGGDVEIKKKS